MSSPKKVLALNESYSLPVWSPVRSVWKLTWVEENGSFQVGILLGTQFKAPERLQTTLEPPHSSQ